jgi:hypothetical protein
MAEYNPKQKMRAFDGEVAIAVAQLYLVHMLQRTLPAGFIAPCLPTKTDALPCGGAWLHEIKHDGFRIIGRKDGERVRLYSRPGNDFTQGRVLINAGLGRMSALGANRTHRDSGNDVNDPKRTEAGLKSRSAAIS